MKYCTLFYLLLLMLMPASAWTQDGPPALVRIQADSKQAVWQGGKFSFYVELLSSTWFTGSPRFDLPDAPEGILYRIQGSPIQSSLNLHGQTYTSQLYEFWFFPQIPGSVTLHEITAHFSTSTSPRQPAAAHSLQTQPFSLEVKPIPRVRNSESIISTDHFDVRQTWQPQGAEGFVGDAITRTIVMKAKNLAGIFLPEILPEKIDGVAIYPGNSDVRDHTDRGEATGIRSDTMTYLFEKEGDYSIETITLKWWNTDKEQLEEIQLPGLEVNIGPNPNYQQTAPADQIPEEKHTWLYVCLSLIAAAVIFAVFRFRRMPVELVRHQKFKYSQSETAFFKKFRQSCKDNDAVSAYNRLYFWLRKRTTHKSRSLSHLTMLTDSPQIQEELGTLNDGLFREGYDSSSWRGRNLYKEISAIRKKLRFRYKDRSKDKRVNTLND